MQFAIGTICGVVLTIAGIFAYLTFLANLPNNR